MDSGHFLCEKYLTWITNHSERFCNRKQEIRNVPRNVRTLRVSRASREEQEVNPKSSERELVPGHKAYHIEVTKHNHQKITRSHTAREGVILTPMLEMDIWIYGRMGKTLDSEKKKLETEKTQWKMKYMEIHTDLKSDGRRIRRPYSKCYTDNHQTKEWKERT